MTHKNEKPTDQSLAVGSTESNSAIQLIRSLPRARGHTHTTQTATSCRVECHLVESVHV